MLTNTIIPTTRQAQRQTGVGLMDNFARGLVLRALKKIHVDFVELYEAGERHCFGDHSAPAEARTRITIRDARFYRAVVWGGTVGAGEAYVDGWWDCDDLTTLIRVILRNKSAFDELNGVLSRIPALAKRTWQFVRRNTRRGSRRNIAAHYDLSNDFYELFLDETMTYSCGIFERPDSTLREASVAKLDRICRKLALSPDDHVIEIGTGWSSFAIHAAREYGCRVTSTTISQQQFELAQERVAQAGLNDRVSLLQSDYRDLSGQFDKLVSIEMVEAVGWQYYKTFFRKCGALLKPQGVACIQAITMADRYYEESKRAVDFIKRYVFPGSCIPSIGAMASAVARATDLTIAHIEDITPHYAMTLRAWHERFQAELPRVHKLGFPDAFIRMWEYYLCHCEAGFCERVTGNVQMLLVKPKFRGTLPLGELQAKGKQWNASR